MVKRTLHTPTNGAASGGPLRALGYPRVSTDEQAEAGYSLPEQREKIAAFCTGAGWQLVDVIGDDFTGRTLERPGLRRVRELAESGAFDVLVCVKLDRLARKNYLRRLFEEWLAARGIEVRFVEQTFEATSSGRFQKGIMGELAEHESELIRERTMGGRLKKAQQRQVMPLRACSYGYHQITKAEAAVIPEYLGRSGELVIVEEQAAVVRRIFTLYAAGNSLRGVATRLNGEGIRTYHGRYWTSTGVRYVLTNSTYAGYTYFGRYRVEMIDQLTSGGNPRKAKTPRPRSEWVPISCPAIVSEELFQACQRQLAANSAQLRGRPTNTWLLHGSVKCGRCAEQTGFARSCTGHTKRADNSLWRYYACTSKKKMEPNADCGTSFRADRLEEMARDALQKAAEPHRLAALAIEDAERRRQQAGNPQAEANRLAAELGRLDEEEGRIADLLLAGISRPVVQQKIDALHERRAAVRQQLAEARARLVDIITPEQAAQQGEGAAEYLRQALAAAEEDPRLLQDLFRLFLEIRIYPDREPDITNRVPLIAGTE